MNSGCGSERWCNSPESVVHLLHSPTVQCHSSELMFSVIGSEYIFVDASRRLRWMTITIVVLQSSSPCDFLCFATFRSKVMEFHSFNKCLFYWLEYMFSGFLIGALFLRESHKRKDF